MPQRNGVVDEWMRARAARDYALQIAAVQHSLAPPPVEQAEASDDVVSVLGSEHGQIAYLVKELEAVPSAAHGGDLQDAAQRVEIVAMLSAKAAQHEKLEEELFWPRIRELGADGARLGYRAHAQESEGDELLQQLRATSATAPEFDEVVERVSKTLRRHVAFEDGVFLIACERIDEDERKELGRLVKDALGLPYEAARQEESTP